MTYNIQKEPLSISFKGSGSDFKEFINVLDVLINEPHIDDFYCRFCGTMVEEDCQCNDSINQYE